jgi:hypothetical protein
MECSLPSAAMPRRGLKKDWKSGTVMIDLLNCLLHCVSAGFPQKEKAGQKGINTFPTGLIALS